jgi:transcriptional regulator with XRE-family HTH domain
LCVLEVNAHARGNFLVPKSLEPDPVDVHVGQRVAVRRKLLKLSQKDLANHVGYSYQQVQKYEHGTNRVSASVLYEFSGALGVPVSFFFEELPTKALKRGRRKKTRTPTNFASDPMRKPDVIKLVRAFDRINDPRARKKMLEAVRSAADALAPER